MGPTTGRTAAPSYAARTTGSVPVPADRNSTMGTAPATATDVTVGSGGTA